MADGGKLAFMSESDIYSLFGNAVDNAVEATEKLSDPERRVICVTTLVRNEFIFVRVENYYEGDLRFYGGIPETTKANRDYHGFGLSSIALITERYGGHIFVSAENGIFTLDLMFPKVT
jgi:sensor histidine kinase regulating citrate/malate metabolism